MLQKSLILFSLIVSAGLGYWSLVYDEQKADYTHLGAQIAEIKNTINQVKVKHASDFFFSTIKPSHPGFHKTQIFTEANSQAHVTFSNTLELTLPPNTLITLLAPAENQKDKIIELIIEKGDVQFKSLSQSTQIKFNQNNKSFVLNVQPHTQGKFQYQPSNNEAALTILSGQAQIPTEEGQAETLKTGESLRLQTATEGANLTQSVTERFSWKAQLLEPAFKKHFDYPTRSLFRWTSNKPLNSDTLTELELSADSDFMTQVERLNVTGYNEYIIPFDLLPPSPIFWRLRTQTDTGDWLYSPASQFSYQKSATVTLSPPTKTFQERGRWKAIFDLFPADPNTRYEVHAGKDPQFKDIYDQSISPSPVAVFMDESGDFYFRARRFYSPTEFTPWSNLIKDTIRPPLSSPQLTLTQEELQTNGLILLNLSWSSVEFAKDYVIQFSDYPSFKKFNKVEATPALSYSLQHRFNKPGYVRVLARSKEGELSLAKNSVSYKGLLQVSTYKNLNITPPLIDDKNPQAYLIASWEQNEDIPSYELNYQHLDTNEKRILKTPNIEIKIPISDRAGSHQLSIKPITDPQKFFSLPSKPSLISYQPPGPLLVPKLLTPKNNEVFLIPSSVQPSIRISWTISPFAQWYTVEVANNPNFNPTFKILKSEQSELILNDRLKDGKWYFRVKSRTIYQTSEWSSAGEFYFGS